MKTRRFEPPRRKHTTSRKHLRTKVTPDWHLTYSKNGGGGGESEIDFKRIKSRIFLHKIICCGDLLESPCGGGDCNDGELMVITKKGLVSSGLL